MVLTEICPSMAHAESSQGQLVEGMLWRRLRRSPCKSLPSPLAPCTAEAKASNWPLPTMTVGLPAVVEAAGLLSAALPTGGLPAGLPATIAALAMLPTQRSSGMPAPTAPAPLAVWLAAIVKTCEQPVSEKLSVAPPRGSFMAASTVFVKLKLQRLSFRESSCCNDLGGRNASWPLPLSLAAVMSAEPTLKADGEIPLTL
mmetsp:Transcript_37264/g.98196  ORF Transcript_37264/g.98196 Transcript_37264/m.98196 type:complete len:200 (+) Transcript_37264:103-702(+)